ncbi:MAG TPA: tetratricopeptide repeat protein, partial [Polyangia bacterium]|nr:tetratricopeptide repeat protein [Polyangia bacterium]
MSSDGPGADPDQTAAAGKRWFDAGNAAFRRGDVAGAVAAYERAVQLSASHPDAWLNLGAAYRRTGRIEAAADAARRALELRPRDPMALNNLANALSAAGRLQEAARCYRQALEIRPADAETWYNLVNLEPLNDGSAESDALLSRLRGLAREPGRYSARQRSALLFAFA